MHMIQWVQSTPLLARCGLSHNNGHALDICMDIWRAGIYVQSKDLASSKALGLLKCLKNISSTQECADKCDFWCVGFEYNGADCKLYGRKKSRLNLKRSMKLKGEGSLKRTTNQTIVSADSNRISCLKRTCRSTLCGHLLWECRH